MSAFSFFNIFKAAHHLPQIGDEKIVKEKYRYWRLRIFLGMYVGYAFFYVSRKSLTAVMPLLIPEFQWSMGDVGLFGAAAYATYGVSKFLSGIVSDRSNPRYFMAFGLMMTGILNILFGISSILWLMVAIWGLNGIFQGFGWPPCARLLTHWYAQEERGLWWGAWNSSHNVGGALIPILAPLIAASFGWRFAMYVPGVICILVAAWLAFVLRDTPQSLGLPPIEVYSHKDESKDKVKKREKELSTKEILFHFVFKNKFIWLLAIAYFFVYVIRVAVNDWGNLFLIREKQYSLLASNVGLLCFEAGGLIGALAAGFLSDRVFSGRRAPINVFFSLFSLVGLLGFWILPVVNAFFAYTLMFIIGFFIFGPQMLIGVAAAELSHKKAAGTATGFVGSFAYAGAIFATWGLGNIIDVYGWPGFFATLIICGLAAVAFLVPMWKIQSAEDAGLTSSDDVVKSS